MPFQFEHDIFNGTTLKVIHNVLTEADVANTLHTLNQQGKQLIWVTLSRTQSHLIPNFTANGFVFHLCDSEQLTLIHRVQEDAYAPFAPTHTLGVGNIVLNDDGQVLLIRDKWMKGKGLKIPGGYVDLGETLHEAAIREVFEETGVEASFEGIVSVVTKHPHQFNKSNAYIICKLTPKTVDIAIQDTDEIEYATWADPQWYINDQDSSSFHRHMVKTLRHQTPLAPDDFEFVPDLTAKNMYRQR